jgi:phosphoribosylformylglycinamidine (FGAM) synthase-like enzyme
MQFLHEGRPAVVRHATFTPPPEGPVALPERADYTEDLRAILHSWDVCSKEWIVRQYDHEVQARTVIKPFVGAAADGPGDAAVVLPVRGSLRGLSVSCGINPRYGELDPYAMAGCVIDEAIRNAVAVGPTRRASRSWTTSAGATPSGPRRSARWSWRRRRWQRPGPLLGTPFHLGHGQPRYNDIHARGRSWPSRRRCYQRHRPGARRPRW